MQSTSPVEPQQSARDEQADPSARHAALHAKAPFAPGTQRAPAQHWVGIAHDAPEAMHGGAGIFSQRFGPTVGGSCTHFEPPQQSPSPPQLSPIAPQPATRQRNVPFASGPHAPEQQSAPVAHASHSARHPPAGAQRFVPSRVARHWREQQSELSLQTSPTCRVQGFLSFIVHAASDVQRSTPLAGSATQRSEQQSPAASQVSPSGRHPWRSAHARTPSPRSWQTRPQQSVPTAQESPAARQPAPTDWHVPAHLFEQQSLARVQGAPPAAQTAGEQIPGWSGPAPLQPSEQHAPARAHVLPSPTQPVVGRHVCSFVGPSAQ